MPNQTRANIKQYGNKDKSDMFVPILMQQPNYDQKIMTSPHLSVSIDYGNSIGVGSKEDDFECITEQSPLFKLESKGSLKGQAGAESPLLNDSAIP